MKGENKSFSEAILKGAVISNPILIQCAGLFPAIAGSTTLVDALFVSASLIVNLFITCFIASAILKRIPRFIRMALYLVIGLSVNCLALYVIESYTFISLSIGMKILIPAISVNSMTAVHAETYSVKHTVRSSVFDALATGLGASAVIVITAIIREIVGNGAIGGIKFNTAFTMQGMTLPFGCLITLGFLAAILNWMLVSSAKNRKSPDSNEVSPEEVDFSFVDEDIPEEADIDLEIDTYDEINDLLSSTDEFLRSLTGGGDRQ